MPDHTSVAATSHRSEPAYSLDGTLALAHRTLAANAIFVVAAAVALGLDAAQTPERAALASIVFAVQFALCVLTALLAAVAPRAIRLGLCVIVPLLAVSIGIYAIIVGAALESAILALCLYMAGTLILSAGPVIQCISVMSSLAAYAWAESVAPSALPHTGAVLVGVAVVTLATAFWQHRRRSGRTHQEHFARLQAEHARATALLATTAALGARANDLNEFASAAAERIATLLDADWAVFWHRHHGHTFSATAVAGLPDAITTTIRAHRLDPDHMAALYDRLLQQPAIILSQREAQRMLPLDTVAPILKHAVASIVRHQDDAIAILFAGYATRRKRAASDAESLLASIAEHVGIAIGNVLLVDEARSANLAKSEFMATMSHELRTPINVVMGYADLLIEGAFGDATQDQLDVLNRVRHQSAQLLDLVQPMLDLNRLEARQTSVSREPFRVIELIESLQLAVPASWCKPGVSLVWLAPIDSGLVMHSDRAKIEMIVRNLIHNALKYTDEGTVTVRVDSTTTPDAVCIAVQDTGTGIAASDLPVLFEMFGQANSDLPRDGGVGLGLYIVKRLTEVLGGRVTVDSTRGVGSTFTVILPRHAPG